LQFQVDACMQTFAEANRQLKHAFIRSKDDDVGSGVQDGSNAPRADATNIAVIGGGSIRAVLHMNTLPRDGLRMRQQSCQARYIFLSGR
jgi:hypothetical protein